uniref:Uncharacterized protein n=1 Tax=Bionectria ochroleuca TaxID=29856 RepID=A0A8H7TNG5_BIOOC
MALVASTTATGRWGDGKITPPLSHPHSQEGGASPAYEGYTNSDVEDVESVHPFITAAAEGDKVTVKSFLNEPSFNVDSMAPIVSMALQQAAISNNQRTVDIILQSNMFGVSEQDVEWLTPLYLAHASTRSESDFLDTVLNYQKNGYSDPALSYMGWKYRNFIQTLLERHANGRVIPPEAIFIEQEHQAAVNILLKNSPDTKLMSHFGVFPLIFAAEKTHEGVVNLLLDKGADIEAKDKGGRSPLFLAVLRGNKAIVKLLLDKGADIEAKDEGGRSPVFLAILRGNKAIVKLLLDNNADSEAKDEHGPSSLFLAV